jgi:hypothetical protein
MLNAGSVFPIRFNSSGPQNVVQNFEKSNPLHSKDFSEYVKALINLEFQTPLDPSYVKGIINGEMKNPWNFPALSNYIKHIVSLELQARGNHRFLSHISFKLLLLCFIL